MDRMRASASAHGGAVGGGRVLVVGSLNADVVARMPRLPAVGETVRGESLAYHPGGKGLNQAVAVARLGGAVSMVGCLGGDDTGAWLARVAAEEGVDLTHVARRGPTTGVALIQVAGDGANTIAVIPGANHALDAADVEAAIAAVPDVAAVLVQLEVPLPAALTALAAGRARGALTLLNPAPAADLSRETLSLCDVVIPNETEAEALSGMAAMSAHDCRAAARHLHRLGARTVVITRGSRGLVWVGEEGEGAVPAFGVDAVDTVAAGDAFCGGLAYALVQGNGWMESLRWASASAAVSTTRAGAVSSLPSRAEVTAFMADQRASAMGAAEPAGTR